MGDKEEDKEPTEEKRDEVSKKRKLPETEPVDIPGASHASPSRSPGVPSWVAGASPAHFVVLDQLNNLDVPIADNMALVHEIAIDPGFKVEAIPKNPIIAAVKESMHRAYWDLLREDLAKEPPVYTHAFNLLMEIKQTIIADMLLPHHVRFRAEIEGVLDENTMRNQLEQGQLCVSKVGAFICEVLGRLCCPARNETIDNLKKEEDLVELIKGIFNIMDVMKVDFTNYLITVNRSDIEEYSRKLEYDKWCAQTTTDSDKSTRAWLKTAYDEVLGNEQQPSTSGADSSEPCEKKKKVSIEEKMSVTTARAYSSLIEVMHPEPFPETLTIDKFRLEALAEKFLQMAICTSAVWVTCNLAGKELSETEGFKKTLKGNLILITNDIEESTLVSKLPAIGEQCVKDVGEWTKEKNIMLPEGTIESIKQQILSMSEEGHVIRTLVKKRMSQFVQQMLAPSSDTVPQRLQPGLSIIQEELYAFMARLVRICVHNRKTFAHLYCEIIRNFEESTTTEDVAASSQ